VELVVVLEAPCDVLPAAGWDAAEALGVAAAALGRDVEEFAGRIGVVAESPLGVAGAGGLSVCGAPGLTGATGAVGAAGAVAGGVCAKRLRRASLGER
jgi:hypothetical protein